MPRTAMGCVGGMLALSLVAGCQNRQEQLQPWRPPEKISKEYGRPLAAGELALRKIDPADYPDFSPAYRNADGLADAIRHSLAYLAKPSSRKYYPYGDITHARAVASLETLLDVIGRVESADALDAVIRRDFEVYQSVGWDRKGTVYFTGYYCPIFDGRKQRDAVYRHPLYGLPDDLIKDSEGRILGRRLADGEKKIRLFHETYQVRAEVVTVHGFSAHADQNELLAMLTANEKRPEQKEWAAAVRIVFPNQDGPNRSGRGTHVNISGAAVTKSAKHRDDAVKLIEYLSGAAAQAIYAQRNFEYPVKPGVPLLPLVASWGDFKADSTLLSVIAEYRITASRIMDRVAFDH